MDSKEVFNGYLEKQALKKTSSREAILRAVSLFKGHFDADALLDSVKKNDARVSRASVYRTIPLLVTAGIVEESVHHDGRKVYEFKKDKGHHDHMICSRCGAILEFSDDVIEKHQEMIAKKYRFKMQDHHLVIHGICGRCR